MLSARPHRSYHASNGEALQSHPLLMKPEAINQGWAAVKYGPRLEKK